MAGFDEILKGFQVFKQGIQEVQTTRAIQGANQQVEQIRQQEADEFEQMKQIRQVAGNLTLQLSQYGTPASQIEQMVGALSPKQETIQSYEQGIAQATARGDKKGFESFKKLKAEEDASKLNLEKYKYDRLAEIAGIKGKAKVNDKTLAQLKEFRADKVAGKDFNTLDELDTASEVLAQNPENNLAYVTSMKGLLKANDPRISDQDFKLAIPNKGLAEAAKRAYSQLVNNEPLTEDIESVRNVQEVIRGKVTSRIKKKAKAFASARGRTLGVDPAEFENQILTDSGFGGAGGSAQEAGAQVIQKKLKDGSIVNVILLPDGTYQEVQ